MLRRAATRFVAVRKKASPERVVLSYPLRQKLLSALSPLLFDWTTTPRSCASPGCAGADRPPITTGARCREGEKRGSKRETI